jgi:hypothetical protein
VHECTVRRRVENSTSVLTELTFVLFTKVDHEKPLTAEIYLLVKQEVMKQPF